MTAPAIIAAEHAVAWLLLILIVWWLVGRRY